MKHLKLALLSAALTSVAFIRPGRRPGMRQGTGHRRHAAKARH